MAKLINCGIVLAILGALYLGFVELAPETNSTTTPSSPPDLVVTPAELVFDRVPFRGIAEQPLRFTNVATYPIRLNAATWQCGCMQMNFMPVELQPGEFKEYTVILLGNSTPAALKGGELTIETSSSTNAIIRIQVRATEVFGISTVPETVDFGRPAYDTLPVIMPLKILVNGMNDTEAESVHIQSSHRAVKCRPLRRNADGDFVVDVELLGNTVVGNVFSTLTITGTGIDSIKLSAFAAIGHSLRAHPPALLLQRLDVGELAVRDDSGAPISIERAVVSSSLEKLLRCVASTQKHYRVEWIEPLNTSGQVVRGDIELHSKDHTGRMITLSVPVTAFCGGD